MTLLKCALLKVCGSSSTRGVQVATRWMCCGNTQCVIIAPKCNFSSESAVLTPYPSTF